VPCRVYCAVISHQQHNVQAAGTPQRIDRLAWGLRDRACDIEGGVDGHLDADVAADNDLLCVSRSVSLLTKTTVDPSGAYVIC